MTRNIITHTSQEQFLDKTSLLQPPHNDQRLMMQAVRILTDKRTKNFH